MTLNNCQINVKADTAANWTYNNPTLGPSEIGIDRTNYEIKIGNGGTWSQTQNFIANNTTVKAIQSTANNALSTANTANSTANNAANIANNFVFFTDSCFPAYPTFVDDIQKNGQTKIQNLQKLAELVHGSNIDLTQPRITDTVTWDGLFICLALVFKQMGLNVSDMTAIFTTFYNYFKAWAPDAPVMEEYAKLEQMKS